MEGGFGGRRRTASAEEAESHRRTIVTCRLGKGSSIRANQLVVIPREMMEGVDARLVDARRKHVDRSNRVNDPFGLCVIKGFGGLGSAGLAAAEVDTRRAQSRPAGLVDGLCHTTPSERRDTEATRDSKAT